MSVNHNFNAANQANNHIKNHIKSLGMSVEDYNYGAFVDLTIRINDGSCLELTCWSGGRWSVTESSFVDAQLQANAEAVEDEILELVGENRFDIDDVLDDTIEDTTLRVGNF